MLVTKEKIEEYLSTRTDLTEDTLKTYANRFGLFYDALPDGKAVRRGTVQEAADHLVEKGYSKKTVNVLLATVDGFLLWAGRPELQAVHRYQKEEIIQPELTRTEYQRLLMTAKQLGKKRDYFFIKVIALTGVNLQELLAIEVADVERGWIKCDAENRRIPRVLQEELKAYVRDNGLTAGPLFQSMKGTPISRGGVTHAIKALAHDARVAEEKCNPRCLRKLYLDAQEQYRAMLQTLVDQAAERQLENEQKLTGWAV